MEISGVSQARDLQSLNSSMSQPKSKPESNSEPKSEEKSEVLVTNTDKVDREIERLKSKLERTSSNEERAKIEEELRLKDNDSYRKQHSEHYSRVDIMA